MGVVTIQIRATLRIAALLAVSAACVLGQSQTATFKEIDSADIGSSCNGKASGQPVVPLPGAGPWTIQASCSGASIKLDWSLSVGPLQTTATPTPTPASLIGYPPTYLAVSPPITYSLTVTANFTTPDVTPDVPTTIRLAVAGGTGLEALGDLCNGSPASLDAKVGGTYKLAISYNCTFNSFFPTSDRLLFQRFLIQASMSPDKADAMGGVSMVADGQTDVSYLLQATPPSLDTIALQSGLVFPKSGDKILANTQLKTPAFFAIANYTLKSQQVAKVLLELTDQTGAVLTDGPPVLAVLGDGTAGTVSGCVGPNKANNCLYIPVTHYETGSTSLVLTALLEDADGKILAKSAAISYPIVKPKFTLTFGSQIGTVFPFLPAPPGTFLGSGTEIGSSFAWSVVKVDYDYSGLPCRLYVFAQTDTGVVFGVAENGTTDSSQTKTIPVGGFVPKAAGKTVQFFATMECEGYLSFQSDPISVPLESIQIGAPTPPADQAINVAGPQDFSFPLTYNVRPGGAKLTTTLHGRFILGAKGNPDITSTSTVAAGPGSQTIKQTASLNAGVVEVGVVVSLGDCPPGPCAVDMTYYNNFNINVDPMTGLVTFIPGGSLKPSKRGSSGSIRASTQGTDAANSFQGGNSTNPDNQPEAARQASSADAAALLDFISIHRTWSFAPSIPADGSFASELDLNYTAGDLPDDPNFDESKLQIVSFNPSTGNFRTYSTALDLTNKVAIAQIDSLEPYYSLAVLGPFSKSLLNFPLFDLAGNFATSLSLVNTGNADGHVTLSGFNSGGTPLSSNPAPSTVAAGKQLLTTPAKLGFDAANGTGLSGWIQAPADGTNIAGVEILGNGQWLEALPATSGHVLSTLLTDIEFDDIYSTEIHVVNPATNRRNLTLSLYRGDGTNVGIVRKSLGPKATLVNRTEALFPALQPPFSGYIVVSGDGDVIASALLHSYSNLSAVSGHPINPAASGPIKLYGAQLGAPGQFARMILVNGGSADANLTLTAYQANGTALSKQVTMKLGARKQAIADLAALFGFDPASPLAGSFTVASDQPTVYGDVTFGDFSVQQLTRATVPLNATLLATAVLPYFENDLMASTTLKLSNPNGSPAAVTVTAYTAAGAKAGSGTVNIPANGFASSSLTGIVGAAANLPAGFIILNSNQPLAAFALVAPASGFDFAAIVAQPGMTSGNASASGSPQISAGGVVNAASFNDRLARGSLGTIFGSNFTTTAPAGAASLPLPKTLAGVTVTVAGIPAPLIYVSSAQINFQVPYEVPPSGSAAVVVTRDGVPSNTANAVVADYAPAVFVYSRTGSMLDPVIVHTDNSLVTPDNPASASEVLIVYATGVGALDNQPATGAAAPSSPPATPKIMPTVTLGSSQAQVQFAGLTPGFAGLAQFNIKLPAALPAGSTAPLVINFGSNSSPPVNLAIKSPGTSGPSIRLGTTRLDFGNVTVGQTKTLQVSVTNQGSATLQFLGLSITSSGDFSSGLFPTSLAPGAQGALNLNFKPSKAGSQQGTVAVTTNDPVNPVVSITVTGAGIAGSTPNFSGNWNTDYGPMTMSQTASNLTGTYPNYSGKITGTVNGNILSGSWTDNTGSGTLTFTLSADGNSFTGTWQRLTGQGNPAGTWNGTRVTGSVAAPLRDTGGKDERGIR